LPIIGPSQFRAKPTEGGDKDAAGFAKGKPTVWRGRSACSNLSIGVE